VSGWPGGDDGRPDRVEGAGQRGARQGRQTGQGVAARSGGAPGQGAGTPGRVRGAGRARRAGGPAGPDMRPGTRTGREKPDRAARARTGPGCRPTRPRSRSHPRSRAGHPRGGRRPHDRVTKVRDVPRVPRGRGRGPSPAMRSEAGGRRTAGPDREPLGRPRSRSVIVPGPHLRTDRTTTPAAPVVTPAAPGQAHHPGAAPRPTAASTTLPRGGRAAPHGRHRPGRLREGRGRGRPDPPSWTVDRVTGRPQSPSNAREPSPDHGRLLGPSPAHVRAGGRSRGRDLAYVAETSLTWRRPRLRGRNLAYARAAFRRSRTFLGK